MYKLFFATKNMEKIRRMKTRLKNSNIEILTPYDLNVNIDIDENGTNVIENATLKAKAYFEKINTPTIATDSSLYVEKFEIQPGLNVRRIKGITLDDESLEKHYINELNKIGGKSKANYVTGVVIIKNDKIYSTEIREDAFIFTSNYCKDKRNHDPLSRLEFDPKLNKYFCQLTQDELISRDYNFDIKTRDFIENVIN